MEVQQVGTVKKKRMDRLVRGVFEDIKESIWNSVVAGRTGRREYQCIKVGGLSVRQGMDKYGVVVQRFVFFNNSTSLL